MSRVRYFFVGWHQPTRGKSGCANIRYTMISINRLLHRKSPFPVQNWILDSGAFTRIASGRGHLPVAEYAEHICRWSKCGNLMAAVSQDYMCEPFILSLTGMSVEENQRLTIERYDALLAHSLPVYLMPVLQGYEPHEYVRHLAQYGDRLQPGMWVGIGSVCKRNSRPQQIEALLLALHQERPNLRLHGFGIKKTALKMPVVWDLLYSADSQAATYHIRRNSIEGKNNPEVAIAYGESIKAPKQLSLFFKN